jgi:RNA polymerase sigma-70 factor, ECF subfamily
MSGAALPAAEGLPEEESAAVSCAAPAADAAAWTGARRESADADFALLSLARGGDRQAFARLVERHHVALASLVRQRAGARAPVEDILQDTFARALTHLPGFRARSSFLTWTATIALNLTTDWIRKERRRARLAPRAEVDGDALPGKAGGDSLELREEAARARAALDALPPAMRVAVTLRVVEDLSYEEVAARLAAPVPRVRTWVSRGLGRLRQSLEVHRD